MALKGSNERIAGYSMRDWLGVISYPAFLLEQRSIVYVNHAVEDLLGCSQEELVGTDWFALIRQPGHSLVEQFGQLLRGPSAFAHTHGLLDASGDEVSRHWIYAHHQGKEKRTGGPHISVVGVSLDSLVESEMERAECDHIYRTLLENTGSIGMVIRGDGIIERANQSFYDIAGLRPEETDGRLCFTRVIHPRDAKDAWGYHLQRRVNDQAPRQYKLRLQDKDGGTRNALVSVDLVPGTDMSVASIQDLTAYYNALEELQAETDRYRSLFENAPVGIFQWGPDGSFLDCNDRMASQLGYSGSSGLLRAAARPQELWGEEWKSFLDQLGHMGEVAGYETRLKCRDGSFRWHKVSARAVRDSDERIQYYEAFASDVEERKRMEENLRNAAYKDPLTGIANKHNLEHCFGKLQDAPPRDGQVGLVYMDVDNMTLINRALGPATGDQLLQHIAERLRLTVDDECLVARTQSDEFGCLISGVQDTEDLRDFAYHILSNLGQPLTIEGMTITPNIRMGLCTAPHEEPDLDTLLRKAETAACRVNGSGIHAYSPETDVHSYRFRLQYDVKEALDYEQFRLYGQPLVDAQTGSSIGMETLLRWGHPVFGTVSPADFIPVLEESDYLGAVTEWVFRQACTYVNECLNNGWDPYVVTVNFSAMQLNMDNAEDMIKRSLNDTGVDPSRLGVELTESTMMYNLDTGSRRLSNLSDMGLRILLDDFGTGYSSLNYLWEFPVDVVKIDKSFVPEDPSDTGNKGFISAINHLLQGMGKEVVVEGVETQQQAAYIAGMGCDYIQGFYYARPAPFQDTLEHILSSR